MWMVLRTIFLRVGTVMTYLNSSLSYSESPSLTGSVEKTNYKVLNEKNLIGYY